MLCVPWVRLLVLHVAILELAAPVGSASAPQPVTGVPPSVKATLPDGAVPVTVAVNVTLAPTSDGLPELDSAVLLGTLPGLFTTCDHVTLVEPLFPASPE